MAPANSSTIPLNPFVYKLIAPLFVLALVGAFLVDWTATHVMTTLALWFLFGCVGLEVGYHRYFSHRMFRTSKFWERIMTVLGIYGAQHSPIWWRALHLQHHRSSDTHNDVHSPSRGFWYALLGWYFFHDMRGVSLRPSVALLRDGFQKFVHGNYYKLFWFPFALLGLLDLQLTYFTLVVPAFLTFMQTNLVNAFCHCPSFGYAAYDTQDNSRNVPLVGYLSWGLGFHNNHHADPANSNFGRQWWEIDPGRYVIAILVHPRAG